MVIYFLIKIILKNIHNYFDNKEYNYRIVLNYTEKFKKYPTERFVIFIFYGIVAATSFN
jgi:hypothetical protein